MKVLPTGISSFYELRSRDAIYVDKTQLIFKLLQEGKYYFLARPRRFGKSLTLSTIQELYSGNVSLFKGLWIEDKWDWSKHNPVVHIRLNALDYRITGLEAALSAELQSISWQFDIALQSGHSPALFRELIQKLYKYKGKVVILIDEYDKPLTDFLEPEDLEVAKVNRTVLRDFYGVIKSLDREIEFCFFTGVSRFSHVNLFSQLNLLTDITLAERFSTIAGYTQTEFETYFEEWIDAVRSKNHKIPREVLLEEIRLWYNGYSFDAVHKVYNPYSILLFLLDGNFRDYWFKTGTPDFLVNLLRERKIFILNKLRVSGAVFESFDLENLEPIALLFQTGYLTLVQANYQYDEFILDFPNQEVERSLNNHLIGALLGKFPVQSAIPVHDIRDAFQQNNPGRVVEIINSLLTGVPYHLFRGSKEAFYHALVHLHFRYLGLYMDSEVHTASGRMDALVQTSNHVYILEFKLNTDADAALRQIEEKGYADPYRSTGKTIIGLGISFDTRGRKVGDWKMKVL